MTIEAYTKLLSSICQQLRSTRNVKNIHEKSKLIAVIALQYIYTKQKTVALNFRTV